LSMSKRNTYKLQNEAICDIRAEVMVIKMIIITKSNFKLEVMIVKIILITSSYKI
jgi:hypothetical protein